MVLRPVQNRDEGGESHSKADADSNRTVERKAASVSIQHKQYAGGLTSCLSDKQCGCD